MQNVMKCVVLGLFPEQCLVVSLVMCSLVWSSLTIKTPLKASIL